MITLQRKKRRDFLTAWLILVLMSVILIGNAFGFIANTPPQSRHSTNSTMIATASSICHKNQAAQNQAAKTSCQGFQLSPYITSSLVLTLTPSLSAKLVFLFIIGLLSMSPVNSLFKPPKSPLAL